jgi:hypothetical protein
VLTRIEKADLVTCSDYLICESTNPNSRRKVSLALEKKLGMSKK